MAPSEEFGSGSLQADGGETDARSVDETDRCTHPTTVGWEYPKPCGACGRWFKDRKERSLQSLYAVRENSSSAWVVRDGRARTDGGFHEDCELCHDECQLCRPLDYRGDEINEPEGIVVVSRDGGGTKIVHCCRRCSDELFTDPGFAPYPSASGPGGDADE